MALVLNGSNNTISGLAAGGLPNASVTADDLASGLATQGITHACTYRLNTDYTYSGVGNQVMTAWEFSDSSFNAKLEDSNTWSLPSSGVFSFPVTGIYSISVDIMMSQLNDSNAWCGIKLNVSTDGGSNFAEAGTIYNQIVQASGSSNQYTTAHTQAIVDVPNISNTKYNITFFTDGNEAVKLHGDSDDNRTSIKVIRLGDT